jgi:hypothetical protein
VAPARATPILESLDRWLQKHNSLITIGTLLVLGTFLVVKGAMSLA